MTTWTEHLAKIRRFLRDPSGNIWDAAFLLRACNDEQMDLQRRCNVLTKVASVLVPPQYNMTYLHPWEYAHTGYTTGLYMALHYHHQSQTVYCHAWEAQELSGNDGSDTDGGYHFTHPWEAAAVTTDDPMLIALPTDFDQTRFIAWDRKPLDYTTQKAITAGDSSHQTRTGEPCAYYRPDISGNTIVLYPKPSTITWDQSDVTDIDSQTGDTITIDADGTVLMVYAAVPDDLTVGASVSQLPAFLCKYIEYGALERAYSANTDGNIESLREYWAWRKKLGDEAIKRFKSRRMTDRDFRLTTKGKPSMRRNRRRPRLPDTYPDI